MLFADIIGQENLKQKLREEIRGEKIPHAQLFLGKVGYGSLALAYAYAQYLFCENKGEIDSCGTCASCNKVQKNIHPDLHHVFPVHTVGKLSSRDFQKEWVEHIQENTYSTFESWKSKIDGEKKPFSIATLESARLHQKLSLKPFEGGYKVLVIYKAEEMNAQFANKFLKLLEEPPAKTVVLLVADEQERLLPTILSRTQTKKVPMIEQDALLPIMKNAGLSDDDAQSLFLRLNGDFGLIRNVLQDGESVNLLRDMFIKLMRVCYKKNVLEMMDLADEICEHPKYVQLNLLEYSLNMIR